MATANAAAAQPRAAASGDTDLTARLRSPARPGAFRRGGDSAPFTPGNAMWDALALSPLGKTRGAVGATPQPDEHGVQAAARPMALPLSPPQDMGMASPGQLLRSDVDDAGLGMGLEEAEQRPRDVIRSMRIKARILQGGAPAVAPQQPLSVGRRMTFEAAGTGEGTSAAQVGGSLAQRSQPDAVSGVAEHSDGLEPTRLLTTRQRGLQRRASVDFAEPEVTDPGQNKVSIQHAHHHSHNSAATAAATDPWASAVASSAGGPGFTSPAPSSSHGAGSRQALGRSLSASASAATTVTATSLSAPTSGASTLSRGAASAPHYGSGSGGGGGGLRGHRSHISPPSSSSSRGVARLRSNSTGSISTSTPGTLALAALVSPTASAGGAGEKLLSIRRNTVIQGRSAVRKTVTVTVATAAAPSSGTRSASGARSGAAVPTAAVARAATAATRSRAAAAGVLSTSQSRLTAAGAGAHTEAKSPVSRRMSNGTAGSVAATERIGSSSRSAGGASVPGSAARSAGGGSASSVSGKGGKGGKGKGVSIVLGGKGTTGYAKAVAMAAAAALARSDADGDGSQPPLPQAVVDSLPDPDVTFISRLIGAAEAKQAQEEIDEEANNDGAGNADADADVDAEQEQDESSSSSYVQPSLSHGRGRKRRRANSSDGSYHDSIKRNQREREAAAAAAAANANNITIAQPRTTRKRGASMSAAALGSDAAASAPSKRASATGMGLGLGLGIFSAERGPLVKEPMPTATNGSSDTPVGESDTAAKLHQQGRSLSKRARLMVSSASEEILVKPEPAAADAVPRKRSRMDASATSLETFAATTVLLPESTLLNEAASAAKQGVGDATTTTTSPSLASRSPARGEPAATVSAVPINSSRLLPQRSPGDMLAPRNPQATPFGAVFSSPQVELHCACKDGCKGRGMCSCRVEGRACGDLCFCDGCTNTVFTRRTAKAKTPKPAPASVLPPATDDVEFTLSGNGAGAAPLPLTQQPLRFESAEGNAPATAASAAALERNGTEQTRPRKNAKTPAHDACATDTTSASDALATSSNSAVNSEGNLERKGVINAFLGKTVTAPAGPVPSSYAIASGAVKRQRRFINRGADMVMTQTDIGSGYTGYSTPGGSMGFYAMPMKTSAGGGRGGTGAGGKRGRSWKGAASGSAAVHTHFMQGLGISGVGLGLPSSTLPAASAGPAGARNAQMSLQHIQMLQQHPAFQVAPTAATAPFLAPLHAGPMLPPIPPMPLHAPLSGVSQPSQPVAFVPSYTRQGRPCASLLAQQNADMPRLTGIREVLMLPPK